VSLKSANGPLCQILPSRCRSLFGGRADYIGSIIRPRITITYIDTADCSL
jgi:hypothetical protein